MSFRKLTKYALAGSLAFGLVAGAGSLTAKAAAPTVEFNYATQELKVTPSGSYFYVVVEVNGKKVSTNRIEKSASGATEVNLSGVNYSKETNIKVYNAADSSDGTLEGVKDSSAIAIVKVPAQPKKVTITFKPGEAAGKQIEVATSEKKLGNGSDSADADWEYRTLYGTWNNGKNLTATKIDQYAQYGTTLCIRQTAKTNADKKSGNLASKEVKLKIPKKANGPKVAVDPVKISVTIPAKSLFRVLSVTNGTATVISKNNTETKNWLPCDSKKTYTVADLNKELQDGKSVLTQDTIIEVKTAAQTKKLESKVSSVTLPKQEDAPVTDESIFVVTPNIDKKKNETTGITIENKSENPIQVVVVEASKVDESSKKLKADTDLSAEKFIDIPAKGKKVIKKATASEGKWLAVRYKGQKANAKKEIPMSLSSAAAVTKIEYPAAPTSDLGATLSAGSAVGTTKITVTGSNILYKVFEKKSKPKFIPINSTKDSVGATAYSSSNADISVKAGQFIVVYTYDDKGKITKYSLLEVSDSHIKKAEQSQ